MSEPFLRGAKVVIEPVVSEAHLWAVREAEWRLACDMIRRWGPGLGRRRVLEIGAGQGFQARLAAADGFHVFAVDVPDSRSGDPNRVWPVLTYDGWRLPFRAGIFDVVFSSNVLEHVAEPWLSALLQDTARVLAEDGVAVHVLPTPLWRICTSLGWPLHCARRGRAVLSGQDPRGAELDGRGAGRFDRVFRMGSYLTRLVPPRHGVRGSVWSEPVYFGTLYWRRVFGQAGWRVLEVRPSGLFYTGNEIFGARLSLPLRRTLGTVLGSATCVWALSRTALRPGDRPGAGGDRHR